MSHDTLLTPAFCSLHHRGTRITASYVMSYLYIQVYHGYEQKVYGNMHVCVSEHGIFTCAITLPSIYTPVYAN